MNETIFVGLATTSHNNALETTAVYDNISVESGSGGAVALNGTVALQGREAAPNAAWSVPLTVDVYAAGETTPTASFDVNTDENGAFSIPDMGVTPGAYVITVKNLHTLKNGIAVDLVTGVNDLDAGELKEGDANNSNTITIQDFSILSTTFGLAEGAADYDARADFNESGAVTIQDFSLLATNFGQAGFEIASTSYDDLKALAGGRQFAGDQTYLYGTTVQGQLATLNTGMADVEIVAPEGTYQQGDIITLKVRVTSGEQAFDGVEMHLRYDTRALRYIGMESTDGLPVGLMDKTNPEAGTIGFASGTFSDLPSGTVDLLELEFEVAGSGAEQVIELMQNFPQQSAITFAGRNILGKVSGGELEIDCLDCEYNVRLYPNPSDGYFRISIQGAGAESGAARVINAQGQIIREFTFDHPSELQELDLRGQASGIYLLHIDAGDNVSTHQLMIK